MEKMTVEHLLNENRKFQPTTKFSEQSHVQTEREYQEMYQNSIENPNKFWLEQAENLDWFKKPSVGCNYIWDTSRRKIEHTWFEDGKINVSYNCLDRHLQTEIKNKPAIIWQGENDEETAILTYEELHFNVCRFANVLKSHGVNKGDRICIYMPMIPELAIAMLACTRIGAIHSIVFGGYSAESIAHRIQDSESKLLITSNVSIRAGNKIPLKQIADEALKETPTIEKVIVVQRSKDFCEMNEGRDLFWHDEMSRAKSDLHAEPMDAEDPLFILYTSGSTGKPKGVVHSQAGYLLYAATTFKYIFDHKPDDIYWCTADIGWVTGHSYVVYGPLANGATTLMFEGVPTFPDAGRFWQIIEKHKVTSFYTAPTAIRALIQKGEEFPKKYDLSSLKILGSVGEPINPEAWMWYYKNIGKKECPIVDTWWQTETGGILISPLPGAHTLKPGCASKPFFGIEPVILNEDQKNCEIDEGGSLCIKKPWPGIMRTMWKDHPRFIDTYFSQHPNLYFSGDSCRKDTDGDYWLMGRMDDVVNISGHRMGTAEVESALVSHPKVAEAAVVPMPHPIKGQGLCAYVILMDDVEPLEQVKQELANHIKREIGPIAIPDNIQLVSALPKTRSGKIMRRILKKIATKQFDELGDISTLADPKIIDELIQGSKQ